MNLVIASPTAGGRYLRAAPSVKFIDEVDRPSGPGLPENFPTWIPGLVDTPGRFRAKWVTCLGSELMTSTAYSAAESVLRVQVFPPSVDVDWTFPITVIRADEVVVFLSLVDLDTIVSSSENGFRTMCAVSE